MDKKFKEAVYDLVGKIPVGKVSTYGQIAAYCGKPNAARAVGQIAHFGPTNLPWHRVVNHDGRLARGFVPDGRVGQRALVEREDIKVVDYKIIEMDKYLWNIEKLN